MTKGLQSHRLALARSPFKNDEKSEARTPPLVERSLRAARETTPHASICWLAQPLGADDEQSDGRRVRRAGHRLVEHRRRGGRRCVRYDCNNNNYYYYYNSYYCDQGTDPAAGPAEGAGVQSVRNINIQQWSGTATIWSESESILGALVVVIGGSDRRGRRNEQR